MNHKSSTEDVLFFVVQSVSRANTVNVSAPPLMYNQEVQASFPRNGWFHFSPYCSFLLSISQNRYSSSRARNVCVGITSPQTIRPRRSESSYVRHLPFDQSYNESILLRKCGRFAKCKPKRGDELQPRAPEVRYSVGRAASATPLTVSVTWVQVQAQARSRV
jgi:hypothetical protein